MDFLNLKKSLYNFNISEEDKGRNVENKGHIKDLIVNKYSFHVIAFSSKLLVFQLKRKAKNFF